MSKISLSPNASGTGVFSILSPATNTDRSLTLPDEAGTVLTSASSLASANLTGTVTVSGGNVGIGTSSPRQYFALHVTQSQNTGSGIVSENTSTGVSASAFVKYQNSGITSAFSGLSGVNRSVYATLGPNVMVGSYTDGTAGITHLVDAAGPMTFATNSVERMRIDSSGNLLVGGSTDLGAGVTQLSDRSGRWALTTNCTNASGGTYYHWNIKSGSSNAGSVTGTTTATSFNTSSDYRLKTDAQPMTGASARVQALNPVNFEWISTGERVDGFLAHEAQEVVPECVTGTKDAMRDEQYEVTAAVYEDIIIAAVLDEEGNELEAERTEQRLVSEAVMGTRSVPDYQGIDQSKLVPLLTAALQEALNKIDAMEIRLAALEAV